MKQEGKVEKGNDTIVRSKIALFISLGITELIFNL